jgi:transcriptional regulator with XRE-family HTH domain
MRRHGAERDRGAGFGALVRRYRLAAGLTQESLADRARLSARAISSYERGIRRAPYPDSLRQLVWALSLSGEEQTAFEAAAEGRRGPKIASRSAALAVHPTNLPKQKTSFVGLPSG